METLKKAPTLRQNKKTIDILELQLPQEIRIKIFEYFEKKELMRLATVSKSWRDFIFGTPRFWRCMNLKLSCRRQSKHNEAACWYAARLGEHFRDLTISCLHANKHIHCDTMAVCLRKLLLNLRQANLTTLIITDLRCRSARTPIWSSIVRILTRILSRCGQLQQFGMPLVQWKVPEGSKFLNTVLSKARGTLHSLRIDGFFKPVTFKKRFLRPVEFDQLTNGILALNHLTQLGIDYFILTDAFVDALSRSYANLRKLTLFLNGSSCFIKIISHKSWANLVKGCQQLKVGLRMISGAYGLHTYALLDLLDPVLHLSDIRIKCTKTFAFYNMRGALNEISHYFSHCLVKLELDLNSSGRSDTEFLGLVRQCKHLVHLNVSANFVDLETARIAMALVEQRRRDLSVRDLPGSSKKRVRANPPDA
ncbi:uncharacterized protein LOC131939017 [Physella acuta]|uniref:uncharacterized protein LOC131939017 n=1 Tax=Physella acuta TaxID=109671 RepID=UPI0027DB68E1|nr:uncharacterized protein LOC131939017 [Physella acuta]